MNISAITKAINGSKLDEPTKKSLVAGLQAAKSDEETLGLLREAWEAIEKVKEGLAHELSETYAAAGITVETSDPEFKAQMKKMKLGVKAAQDDYDQTMGKLEVKAKKIEDKAGKEFDDLGKKQARAALADI